MKKLGLVLVIVGIALAVFTGFDFFTRKKVIDIGSVEITANKKHSVDWSPILGLVTAAVGAGMFFIGMRRDK